MSEWPWPNEAEICGDGGGCGKSDPGSVAGVVGVAGVLGVFAPPTPPAGMSSLDCLPLCAEANEAASDLSTADPDSRSLSFPPLNVVVDTLGLSGPREAELGIFDFNELFKERDDPWVSDFEKEGYESRLGPSRSPVGVALLLPFSPLDGWFPMAITRPRLCLWRYRSVGGRRRG